MAEKKSVVFQKTSTILLVIAAMTAFLGISESIADTAEQQFYSADAYCQKFLEDSEKTKYRDNWLFCIQKFKKAYRTNPASSLASASLYWIGKLYHELYSRSFLSSDKEEAIDSYERLIKRYPRSKYRKMSETELAKLSAAIDNLETKTPLVSKDPDQKPVDTKNSAKVSVSASRTQSAPKTAGPVPHKRRERSVEELKKKYREKLAAENQSEDIAQLILQRKRDLEKEKNSRAVPVSLPSQSPSQNRPDPPSSPGSTIIQGLRVWSNPSYTRIVVDGDNSTPFQHRLLNKDKAHNKPPRLYIDFEDSRLGQRLEKVTPINDDLLIAARAGQWRPDVVRVVVDIKSFQSYKVFALHNPFRIIIDIWGTETQYARAPKPAAASVSI